MTSLNQHKLVVEDWEVLCNECKGTGKRERASTLWYCQKCQGEGKLDWIENIVGKPERNYGSSSSSSSSSTIPTHEKYLKEKLKKSQSKKRRIYEHNNSFGNRTIQRLHKMFNKFKRHM